MCSHSVRVVAMISLAGLACATEPCACPPAASALVVYGRVLDGGSNPINGAGVDVFVGSPDCRFPSSSPPFAATTSTADGGYRASPSFGVLGAAVCLRVMATDRAGTGEPIATVEGVLAQFPHRNHAVDSVGIMLRGK